MHTGGRVKEGFKKRWSQVAINSIAGHGHLHHFYIVPVFENRKTVLYHSTLLNIVCTLYNGLEYSYHDTCSRISKTDTQPSISYILYEFNSKKMSSFVSRWPPHTTKSFYFQKNHRDLKNGNCLEIFKSFLLHLRRLAKMKIICRSRFFIFACLQNGQDGF